MNIVDDLMIKGRDAGQFVNDYILHLRNLMITASVADAEKILNVSSESVLALRAQNERISKEEVSGLIRVFSELASDMKYAANKRVLLEVCLIKLCTPVTEADYTAVAAKVSSIERELKSGKYTKIQASAPIDPGAKPKPKSTVKKAETEDYKRALETWGEIASSFNTPDDIIVKKAELKQLDGNKIYVVADNDINARILEKKYDEISAAFEEKLGKSFELEVISKAEYGKRYEMLFGTVQEESDDFDDEDWAQLMPGIEIEP